MKGNSLPATFLNIFNSAIIKNTIFLETFLGALSSPRFNKYHQKTSFVIQTIILCFISLLPGDIENLYVSYGYFSMFLQVSKSLRCI